MLLRAEQGSPALTENLEKGGIAYEDIPIYRTNFSNPQSEQLRKALESGELDYVTFTSASTVKGFVSATGEDVDYSGIVGLCIGEQTAAEARNHGIPVRTAKAATIDALVQLACDTFS